jgi:hypothetical protein
VENPLEGRLERLLAKEEIRGLARQYARDLDARDAPGLCGLWLPFHGAALPWIDLGVVQEAIIPSWSTRGRSEMRVVDHDVELQGDGARGVVSSEVLVEIRDRAVYQSVRYFDEYGQADAGEWRFVRRFHHLVYGCLAPVNPWRQRLAQWPAHQVGSGGEPFDADAFLATGLLTAESRVSNRRRH